jgi:hypothetical protein
MDKPDSIKLEIWNVISRKRRCSLKIWSPGILAFFGRYGQNPKGVTNPERFVTPEIFIAEITGSRDIRDPWSVVEAL